MFLPKKYLISGVLFILGLAISFVFYLSLRKANELRQDQIYSGIYDAISMSIQREIDVNINALHAIKGSFLASEHVRRDEFIQLTEFYISNIKSIQALEWVPKVYHNQRDSLEKTIRRNGFPDFEIFTTKNGERVRAEKRKVYYPVTYISPYKGNEAALGFDPGESVPARSNTIQKAIASRSVAVSDVINIVQKSMPHKAVLVFVPVFDHTNTLIGLVEGVYLANELIQSGVSRLEFSESIKISLKDERGNLMYGNEAVGSKGALTGSLRFGDRNYMLHIEFLNDIGTDVMNIRLFLATCLIITLFVVGITFYALKTSERQNKRSKANIQSVFKLSESAIALFDINLKLLEWNESFATLTKELTGIMPQIGILIPKEFYRFEEKLQKKIQQGEQIKLTAAVDLKGAVNHFVFNYLPIYEEGKVVGFCALIDNVTEIMRYESELETYSSRLQDLVEQRTEQLDHSNKELIKRNRELSDALNELKHAQDELVQSRKMASLGVISAGVGHEINNPLNFIIGGVTILESSFKGQLNDEQESAISNIKLGAKRASDIVKTIGRFSRKTQSVNEPCSLHGILDGCLLMMSGNIRENVVVKKNYASANPIVKGNEGMLHQAFLNVLMNAEQALGREGEIIITTDLQQEKAMVSIKDNGAGITDEDLSKVMDPFFSTKEPGKGVGLGLFITYNIISELKGKIEFDSKLGEGTECIISLNMM
ncbi:MAG: CHASE domain-containing protein [Cyclobacteriaceae bacterium]